MTKKSYMQVLEPVINDVIAPGAMGIDGAGTFPRENINALAAAGLLGLISADEVGGSGEGMRAAVEVVEKIAQACGSTAMVVCMHYAGAAVIEKFGPRAVREDVAAGKHLTTLAFSEAGSRSQFWAPMSTSSRVNGHIRLDAAKSWITSAGEADSYVWSSRPLAAEGLSTLWLVPAHTDGLKVAAPFTGLGLRGNASSPVHAHDVAVSPAAMLGDDGKGFDVMMSVVLPWFSLMNTAMSIGTMRSALSKATAHVSSTRLEHAGQSLADLPTIRAYLARAQIKTDMAHALIMDTLDALEQSRPDAMMRVLEAKAGAGEAAVEVTDLAMRVCGGAAYRKEVGVERHFRDARASTVMAPTADALYDFIGKAMCGMPLF